MHVRTIAAPAIEIEQRLHLLGHREAQQVAGIGAADFLECVEKGFRRKRLNQSFGFRRRQNQIELLPRRKPVEKFELLLERKIDEVFCSARCHRWTLNNVTGLRPIANSLTVPDAQTRTSAG